MGPPPGVRCPMRMSASWLGSNDPTEYKSVARRALNGELPSDPPQTGTDQTPNSRQQNPRSACSGVKRCETQAPLRRHAANLCYRFGPLTPSARSANLFVGDGAKNGSPAPNKEPTNHKQLLDSKSPIQVRVRIPPGRVCKPSVPQRRSLCLQQTCRCA